MSPRRYWAVGLLAAFCLFALSTSSMQAQSDEAPTFGMATIADQTWAVGEAIATGNRDFFQLPRASGGDGKLTYSLTPDISAYGLTFGPGNRQIRGTPDTELATTEFTYKVVDADSNMADSDAAILTFNITITDTLIVDGHDEGTTPTITENRVDATVGGVDMRLYLPNVHGVERVTFADSSPSVAAPSGVDFGTSVNYVGIDLNGVTLSADATVCLTSPGGRPFAMSVYRLPDGGTAWTSLPRPSSRPAGFVCGATRDFSDFVVGDTGIRFKSNTISEVSEGIVAFYLGVRIDGTASSDITVTLAEAPTPGTATIDTDWTLDVATLTIGRGRAQSDAAAVPVISVFNDSLDEDTETINLIATATIDGVEMTSPVRTITITDDDDPPTVSLVGDPTFAEGETGQVTVRLSAVSGRDVTVGYSTADGTATAGSDYTAAGEGREHHHLDRRYGGGLSRWSSPTTASVRTPKRSR